MSTGKRLAKRSIIGTRVSARCDDGFYYSGVIHAVKTPATYAENNNCINLTPNTRFSVRFDSKNAAGKRGTREYAALDLVGPGFRGIHGLKLSPGQKIYLTFNGREVTGDIRTHDPQSDEVHVVIHPSGCEMPIELVKRLDEVRLLESRKSARLADQDTDFARLADMAGDRRKSGNNLEMPPNFNPRKRRPSSSGDSDMKEDGDMMDECNAALVLMSLSCSPHSPLGVWGGRSSASPAGSSTGSWRSATPSPPLGDSPTSWPASFSDEGIGLDYYDREEQPKKKKTHRVAYKCTWPGCNHATKSRTGVEAHIRRMHLASRSNVSPSDREEEFYYTETDAPPPPTLSHRDMCRPPHEDPEYQRQLVGSFRQGLLSIQGQNGFNLLPTGPIPIPSVIQTPWANSCSPSTPQKHMKLSGGSSSPVRRPRDSKKCRKVYGMEHRDNWCTQCKWKKACTRFGD